MEGKKGSNTLLIGFLIGAILIVGCIVIAIMWYNIFTTDKQASTALSVIMNNSGKALNVNNMQPTAEEEVGNYPAYTFTVANNDEYQGHYEVIIEDSVKKDINNNSAGYLKRNQLKYQLILNNRVIGTDMLSTIKKNVLDTRTIIPNKINKYELRIWVPADKADTDWQNKTYNFKILVKPVNKE